MKYGLKIEGITHQAVSVTVLLFAVIIIIFRQILAAKGDGTDE